MMRVVAIVAALLVFAGSARAAGTAYGPEMLAGGPVLAGDRVVYATSVPSRTAEGDLKATTTLYSAPAAGGPSITVKRIGVVTDDDEYTTGRALVDLHGSPGHLAWITDDIDTIEDKYEGGAVAPLTLWFDGHELCHAGYDDAGIALAGDLLATSGCGGVLLAGQTLAPGGGPVRAAGGFVAWWAGTAITVRGDGTQVTLPATPVNNFAVGADGTVAAYYGTRPEEHATPYVEWASPSAPTWHRVDVANLVPAPLKLAGGRIALAVHGKGGSIDLRLMDLGGHFTTVAHGDDASQGELSFAVARDGFDFDGTRVAWAGDVCDALVVRVSKAGALATLPTREACAVALAPDRIDVNRVHVRCPAPWPARRTDVCEGTLHVAGDSARFRIKAGAEADVRLRARGRRRVTARSVTRGHVTRTSATIAFRSRP